MKMRLKPFIVLILFCIGPLLFLGNMSMRNNEQHQVVEEKKHLTTVLNLGSSILKTTDALSVDKKPTIDINTLFSEIAATWDVQFFLTHNDGELLRSRQIKSESDIPFTEIVRLLKGNMSKIAWRKTFYETDLYFALQKKVAGGRYHLVIVSDKKLFAEKVKKSFRNILFLILAGAISTIAGGFIIYGYFVTQKSMLHTFIGRIKAGGVLPTKVPDGEFVDISRKYLDLVAEAEQSRQEFERLRSTDELTGVFNNKIILKRLEDEAGKSKRYNTPLSIILFNIDTFSKTNDTHTFQIGDQVLCRLAAIFENSLRSHDLVGRSGGDEFLLVLPLIELRHAVKVAERIRAAVEVSFWGVAELQITVSGGVLQAEDQNGDEICKELAELVTKAKTRGRNQLAANDD